jgi:hypothetical protein
LDGTGILKNWVIRGIDMKLGVKMELLTWKGVISSDKGNRGFPLSLEITILQRWFNWIA